MKFAQNGTRNNGRLDYQRSDNEIRDKYEVMEWDYELDIESEIGC